MFKNVKTKKVLSIFLLAITAMIFSSVAFSVESLRGDSALDSDANKPKKHKVATVSGGIERNYKLQPPMIPHKIDKYRISIKNNGCMKCHSEKAYKKEKATRVGESHYIARDGTKLDHLSSRRYFCTQCHVSQTGDSPLVENTYEGI
ncbi:MAG: nitrate reductase cytochrome c-type subunit [Gammaproteobacteria bacterium]|nr:nitrate reductase cytochrome c-type subunit [Gammaproteobacteria bacterium]